MQFIDLQAQYQAYKADIDAGIKSVLDSSRYVFGPQITELEEALQEFTGAAHAIACSSGTDALILPLMAKDIQPGDEIITTPFTFIATAEVISFLKAVPAFVDIDPRTYNIDPTLIEAKITSKTKGIIPVSLYGQAADMDAINSIGRKHGLFVLEDAAQSLGAKYKKKFSGALSEISATSFFPSKPLGCYGDGGMIFTEDADLAQKMRELLNHGQNARYVHSSIGMNGRLDTIQAAVLLAKLKHFNDECDRRFEIGKRYSELFKDSEVVTPFIADYTDRHVYAQYSIQVKNRDKVAQKLQEASVPTAVHYPIPIHLQKAFECYAYKKGDFPVSEKISSEIMSLPMHPFLDETTQNEIVSQVKQAVDAS